MGDPTSSLRYHQHSSQDHVTTQAPPLLQSRDTFGGVHNNDIEHKYETVFLGLHLNENIQWYVHIKNLSTKLH